MFLKRLFKHRHTVDTYFSQPVYGELRYITTDGMGTKHHQVWARCKKCGQKFHVVNVHTSK